jgi:hypothetical protein
MMLYNTACCESLAGRTADAIEHLRSAAQVWDGCKAMANEDSDFDPIRDEPAFQAFIGR